MEVCHRRPLNCCSLRIDSSSSSWSDPPTISALSRTSSQLAPSWKVKALGLAWLGFAYTGLTPQQFTLWRPLPKSDQYWIRKSNEIAAAAWWPLLTPSGSPIPIFRQGYNPSMTWFELKPALSNNSKKYWWLEPNLHPTLKKHEVLSWSESISITAPIANPMKSLLPQRCGSWIVIEDPKDRLLNHSGISLPGKQKLMPCGLSNSYNTL